MAAAVLAFSRSASVFLGFLASRPDLFCPLATVGSNHGWEAGKIAAFTPSRDRMSRIAPGHRASEVQVAQHDRQVARLIDEPGNHGARLADIKDPQIRIASQ